MLRSTPRKAVGSVAAAVNKTLVRLGRPSFESSILEPLESRRLMSVNVTTYHYNNQETGSNTNETVLSAANVNTTTFGKIASLPVDGQVYAQPLVMTNVAMGNGQGTHDILIVATENDSVYAFDANGNNPAQGYLWKDYLPQNGETAVPQSFYPTNDITPTLGITGTPVIDPSTNTLYVVGLFRSTSGTYSQRLYALNLATGANNIAPVTLAASVPGTGAGSVNGTLAFDPYFENQRPALTLFNGEVYIGFASHGDESPWHGWVLGYNAATLHQDYVYCTTPNGDAGGIWMSGGGLAVDSSGNLYFTTGNGDFSPTAGNYSMSIEKLSPTLTVQDYFAPYDQANLSNVDLDYGCANVILLSNQSGAHPNEMLTAGKWGTIYLNSSDTGALGQYNATTNADLGEANITNNLGTSNVHQTMAYWNGYVYLGGDALTLQAFPVANFATGTITPFSSQTSNVFGNPGIEDGQGAGLTISSNGTSNGILWALDNGGFNNNPATLYAYNANNLGQLLWTSNQAAGGRDTASNAVKFQDPVVANGHVYTAGSGSVTIYGVITPSTATPTVVRPASATPSTVTGTTTSLNVSATDPSPDLSPVYTWAVTNSPAGAVTPTFSINGTNAAGNPTATFYQAGNYAFTATVTDPNSGLGVTSSVNVVVNQVLSNIAVSPSPVTVFDAATQQFSASTVDQFGNAMSPQPAFTWTVQSGGVGGTVNSSGLYTAPYTGAGSDTVTATSGSLSGSGTITVVPPSATLPVNLSATANRLGIVSDGNTFAGGLDGGGSALSGNLLGTSQNWNGSSFTIPAATTANNVFNVVYGAGQAIALMQKRFSALKFLADGTQGNQVGLTFTVTYIDNRTQTFTQSVSDWYTPQNFAGEGTAVTMPYRDNGDGTRDGRTFYTYGYNFSLNPSVAIKSLTLPNNTNFELIALDLVGIASTGTPTITTAAAANPTAVTGTATILSALAIDPAGDQVPTYTWAATNISNGATTPTFSVNGTNSANISTATFYQAGSYTFTVTIKDPSSGNTAISSVSVSVAQTMTGLSLSPPTATVVAGSTKQFSASAVDQFGQSMASTITWSLVNSTFGTISSSGLYTAPANGTGSVTVQASAAGFTAQSTVQVANVGTATFYPVLAGWYRAGVWQGLSGVDGGGNYTSPAGGTVLIAKNPAGGTLRDPYLQFNLGNSAFAGDTINSVTITFSAAALNQAGPLAFGVYSVSNNSWGAATADPSPAPGFAGATLIGSTQNVGGVQGNYSTYTFSLGNLITNATSGLLSFELNSPAGTGQETGIEIDSLLNTPGIDPVITINYTVPQPAWLGAASQATWNGTTKMLNVNGPTTIIGDPGSDQPIIQANGSAAVITINPTSALQIHLGGLKLTNGATATVTSLGAARTSTNHRVLVLGLPGATSAPPLSIGVTSKLDLTDNDLVDHDGSIAAVTSLVASNNIVSSNAGLLTTLGTAQPSAAGTFDTETVGTSDVEIRYTFFGDANLDGHVDGSDYSRIDNGYLHNLTGFANGDFNYDGVVNGSDYTLIDNIFNTQAASLDAAIAAPAAQLSAGAAVTPQAVSPDDQKLHAKARRSIFSDIAIATSAVGPTA